jgi:hypothetical protein
MDDVYRTHWQGVHELYSRILMFRLWEDNYVEQYNNMTFEEVVEERRAWGQNLPRPEMTDSLSAYQSVWEETSDMMGEFFDGLRATWSEGRQVTWFYDIVAYFSFTREELNRANSIVGELLIDEEIDLLLGDDVHAFNQIATVPWAIITEDGTIYSAEWFMYTPVSEIRAAGVTTEMIEALLDAFVDRFAEIVEFYERSLSEALSEFLGRDISLREMGENQ